MSKLQEGVDNVFSVEEIDECTETWPYATTHTYTTRMILWCGEHRLEWGMDMNIQTYRITGRPQNSHRWYFKDPEVATLFALMFS